MMLRPINWHFQLNRLDNVSFIMEITELFHCFLGHRASWRLADTSVTQPINEFLIAPLLAKQQNNVYGP